MDVYKLIEATKAEIVCNQAIARVGDARVVIAKVVGDAMVLTAEGEELAATQPTEPKAKASKAKPASADA
jgi:hypothetical protein